jgi:beta-phosphoglucomutase-like phosphatase (HAD superfamily)
MLLQAVSDLGLDPARCAISGDKISDIEAGAAAGIARRFSSGRAMPKRVDHLMKWSPILAKRPFCDSCA